MRLFSEKVVPTFTSSTLNILTVEDFNEIFFDVFEFEINGKKFIAEKVSNYKGSPVVDIPLVLEGKEFTASFVLQRGKFEILFNKANSTFVRPVEQKAEESIVHFEEYEDEIEDIIFEKKETILKEIQQARQSAEQYVEDLKQQKLQEATKFFDNKKRTLDKEIDESKKDLLEEFLSLVENVKSEFYEFNEDEKSRLVTFIEESIDNLSDRLSRDIEDKNEQAEKVFSEKINELATNVLSGILLKEIDSNNKKTTSDIASRFEAITTSLNRLTEQRDKQVKGEMKELLREYSDSLSGLEQANVELNDLINKSNNKALSRIGNVKTQLEESILYTENSLKSTITNTKDEILNKVQFTENKIDAVEKTADIIANKFTLVEGTVNEAKNEIKAAVDIVNNADTKLETVRIELEESIHNISDLVSADVKADITKLKKDITTQISITEDKIDLTSKNTALVEEEVNTLKQNFSESANSFNANINTLTETVQESVAKVDKKIEAVTESIAEQLDTVNISVDRLKIKSVSLDSNIKELEEKIVLAEDSIINYYDERINLVESKVTDLSEDNKQYFIGLIEESKQTLLEQINNIKVDVPNIIVEKANGSQEVDLKGMKSELEKIIGTKFSTELMALKRLIEMSSGGGSVAKQFANGGTMNGNLTVTGSISASNYLGISTGPYAYGTGTAAIKPILGCNIASAQGASIGGGGYGVVPPSTGSTTYVGYNCNGSLYPDIADGAIYSYNYINYPIIAAGSGNKACGILSHIGGGGGIVGEIYNCYGVRNCTTNSSYYENNECTGTWGHPGNIANGDFSTIGGGIGNTASTYSAAIGGGCHNTASGYYSTVGGGCNNTANNSNSFIGGGTSNTAAGTSSTIAGGRLNTASGQYSTLAGGNQNTASGYASTIGGGKSNISSCSFATVAGGSGNTASGYCGSTVAGGQSNTASNYHSTIGGGLANTNSGYRSTIGGGSDNTIEPGGCFSFIGGGWQNTVNTVGDTIGGGCFNTTCSTYVDGGVCGGYNTIAGGQSNSASGFYGGQGNTVGGGYLNTASGYCIGYATVAGGYCNNTVGDYTSIGGGNTNTIQNAANSTIGGGACNTVLTECAGSTIGGGISNISCSIGGTIGGGNSNTVRLAAATVAGGQSNNAIGACSFVGGGLYNRACGTYSGILGGTNNLITHACSFTIGVNLTSTATCTTYMNNATVVGNISATGNIASNSNYVVTLSLSSNKTANNATDTPIIFNYKKNDPNSWSSVFGASATRITPTIPGYYFVNYQVSWQQGISGGGNQNNIQILKTGSTIALTQQPINGSLVSTFLNTTSIIYLNGSTDYLTFQAYSSNAAQVITGSNDGAWTKVEVYKIN